MRPQIVRRICLVVAACAVAAGALFVAFGFAARAPWFLEQARTQIERGVGRKVSFSSLAPSLFPGIGVRAFDFRLYEKDGQTACLDAERIALRVRLLPLLWRTLRIKTVRVDRPRLSLVRDRDGRWNIEDLIEGKKAPAAGAAAGRPPGPSARPRVTIAALRVRGGLVTARDEATGREAAVRDLDLVVSRIAEGGLPHLRGGGSFSGVPLAVLLDEIEESRALGVREGLLSGRFTVDGWTGKKLLFSGDLRLSGLGYEIPGIWRSPPGGADFDLRLRGEGAVSEDGWRFSRIAADGLGKRLTGEASFDPAAGGGPTAVDFAARSLPWDALGEPIGDGRALGGEASFAGAVRREAGRHSAEIELDLSKSRIAYGGVLDKAAGAIATLKLPLLFGETGVSWKDASARLGTAEFLSDGEVATGALKARIRSSGLDLREIGGFIAGGAGLSGRGDMDLRVACARGAPLLSAEVSGTVRVPDGEFSAPSLPHPLRFDAVVSCEPGSVRLGLNTLKTGSSLAEGYVRLDLADRPAFDCELNCPRLDGSDFAAAGTSRGGTDGRARPGGQARPGAAEAAAPPLPARPDARPPGFLERLEGRGKVSVGELKLGRLVVRNGRARVRLSNGVAALEEIVLPFYGGEANGTVSSAILDEPPRHSLTAALKNVDLEPLLADIYAYPRRLSGTLSAECVARGAGAGWEEIRTGFAGNGRFSVKNCVLHSNSLLKGLAPLMLMLGTQADCKEFVAMGNLLRASPSEMRLSRCEGTFALDADGWGTGDMVIESADPKNPLRLAIEGEMGLDGVLGFLGTASFPRGSAYYAQLAPYFPDDGGWIALPFPVPIGGTLGEPRVDADAAAGSVARSAAGIGKARVRKELEKKIDKAFAPKIETGEGKAKPSSGLEEVGRELLKGGSKQLLKQMLKP